MFRIIYPSKDATLYETEPNLNSGLDEILEVGKRINSNGDAYLKSRSLIQFSMTDISNVLDKYSITLDNCKFMLKLYTTNAKNLPDEYTINANIVADSWKNGTGQLHDSPYKTDGVAWNYIESGSSWSSAGSLNDTIYITGSTGGSWLYQTGSAVYGEMYYGNSFYTQPGLNEAEDFSYRPTDLNIEVTDAIKMWISGSAGTTIPNNGFLLKMSDVNENDPNLGGYIRFFSRETHTIYVPRLEMYWDDSIISSSLDLINDESYSIYTNIKRQYKDTEISKIRIYSRDKYPQKSALNKFPITTVKKLPNTTYYSIIDAATDEVIIPYDDIYTKLSCDNTSNYFYLDFNGLMPERYYRIEIKIVDGFTESYVATDTYFKVVR